MLPNRLKDLFRPPRPVGHCALVTGLPRSGTTLTCHLLNKAEDTVALHEPMDVTVLCKAGSSAAAVREIHRFLGETRRTLLGGGRAPTKHVAGSVPDNPIGGERNDAGLRKSVVERGEVSFGKPLSPDFLLVVKHPAAYAALLPELRRDYPVFAVVRNPLSVLCSWNTVDLAIYDGRIPVGEALDPALGRRLDAIPERLDRQLCVLDWFCRRFVEHLPSDHILRYEDTVAAGGRNLEVVTPAAAKLEERLESKNKSGQYGPDLMRTLGERLLASDGAYWKLYEPDAVRELLAA